MIPAVLPSPRADAPANARPMDEDHGFDDALRRAAGTGTTAGSSETEQRATGDPVCVDDEARTAPTEGGNTIDQPPAGEPPADREPVREDETEDVAAPAATVVAPATAPRTGALPHALRAATAGVATAASTSSGTPATGTAAVSAVASDELLAPTPEVDGDAGGPLDASGDPLLPTDTAEPSGELPDAGVEAPEAESLRTRSGTGPDRTEQTVVRRDAPVAPALTGADASSATAPPVTDDLPAVTATTDGDVAPVAAAPTSHTVAPADRVVVPGPSAAAQPVAQQLVEHVAPLVEGPDGTHELTIELRPATLGRVELEVTLEDGVLHVRVHADDPASRRLLGQSLGDLRTALADAGISAGTLDVGDPGSGGARTGDDGGRADPGPDDRSTTGGRAAAPSPSRPHPDGRLGLDVLL